MPKFAIPMPFLPIKIDKDETLRRMLVSSRFPVTCIPASWANELGLTVEKIKPVEIDPIFKIRSKGFVKVKINFYDDAGRNAGESSILRIFLTNDLSLYGIFGSKDLFSEWTSFRIFHDEQKECFVEYKVHVTKQSSQKS